MADPPRPDIGNEVADLEADEADRAEMLALADVMASMRPVDDALLTVLGLN